MQIEKADVLISFADELYPSAPGESMRFQDDGIAYLIYCLSRQAIPNYYQRVLLKNEIFPQSPPGVEDLMEYFRNSDARLDTVSTSTVDYRFDTEQNDYSLERFTCVVC